MKYIIFKNKGVITETAITTFGISSKETTNAIGFFGTGLKYAIAICLRERNSISIYRGLAIDVFDLKRTTVRVDEFDIITKNDVPLAFSTELGKTWTIEQAFRELYCNTMDEGGEVYLADELPEAEDNLTYVIISGSSFLECYYNRSHIILDSTPVYSNAYMEIHDKASEFVYYRGIQAMKLSHPSRFTYNVLQKMDLTEDRTIKYNFEAIGAITRGIVTCDNPMLLKDILLVNADTFEESLDYSYSTRDASEVFKVFSAGIVKQTNARFNVTLVSLLSKLHMPVEIYVDAVLNSIEKKAYKKAYNFCKKIGYDLDKYPVRIVDSLGTGVLGQAKDETILVSKLAFSMGTKMVTGTLIEEFIHLEYSVRDGSRAMQEHLLNHLVGLGELYLKTSL